MPPGPWPDSAKAPIPPSTTTPRTMAGTKRPAAAVDGFAALLLRGGRHRNVLAEHRILIVEIVVVEIMARSRRVRAVAGSGAAGRALREGRAGGGRGRRGGDRAGSPAAGRCLGRRRVERAVVETGFGGRHQGRCGVALSDGVMAEGVGQLGLEIVEVGSERDVFLELEIGNVEVVGQRDRPLHHLDGLDVGNLVTAAGSGGTARAAMHIVGRHVGALAGCGSHAPGLVVESEIETAAAAGADGTGCG